MTSLEYNDTTKEKIPKADALVMSSIIVSYLAILSVARPRKMPLESRNWLLDEKITHAVEAIFQELLFAPSSYPMWNGGDGS